MSNTRVLNKADYIKELKQQVQFYLNNKQIDAKPSKLELYKEKLNERELYEKNNMFDYFGREGAGAPLRSDDGRIRTKRRTMLNDNYEELSMNNDKQNQNIRANTNYYNQFQKYEYNT